MKRVWWITDAAVTALGVTTAETYSNLIVGESGVRVRQAETPGEMPICASLCADLEVEPEATRFETLAKKALDSLSRQVDIPNQRTLFILSTTKGNIELLEQEQQHHSRIHLHRTAADLTRELKPAKCSVISNACASGVTALVVAKRQIECGNYDHAIILGADVVSKFIVTGFQSLNALSQVPCKPFDAQRGGINLGEAASCVLLSSTVDRFETSYRVTIAGGALSNDANHISGPSKTGEELASAVRQSLAEGQLKPAEVDFISAHGTATLYNDEMEAKAFNLSGLSHAPIHSLKGYFGHTLGAAGLLESIISVQSLLRQELIPSAGFEILGVSKPLNIIRRREAKSIRTCLKTSSGFGGSNAAVVFTRES